MDFKFIHAADIHLDSPLRGLERYEGAPAEYIRNATREALKNMVEVALKEEVSFVLVSGDLYDGDWRDYNTGLFFSAQVARLRDAGVRVFLVRGNHDAASQITRQLRLPDNLRDFSTTRPETVYLEELGVALHGQGFANPAVTEDLSRRYPSPARDYFNIGLLHTCASGREGHENYAPSDINYLASKGYDYWALGHVHNRELLREDPYIIFPGNIQGRHIRESGARGCMMVSVRNGQVDALEHVELDVLRWSLCEVDAAGAKTMDDILERAEGLLEQKVQESGGRFLAVRFIVTGACQLHSKLVEDPFQLQSNMRSLATFSSAGKAWVEKVEIRTRPLARPEEVWANHPSVYLLNYSGELQKDDETLLELLSELERDKNALPSDIFEEGDIDLTGPDYIRSLLPQVEELIFSRLREKGGLGGEA